MSTGQQVPGATVNDPLGTAVPQGLSFGQKAVGLTFNPSGSDEVALAKQECANLIDHMNTLRMTTESPEVKRLASVAITQVEIASMCCVKAITWKD